MREEGRTNHRGSRRAPGVQAREGAADRTKVPRPGADAGKRSSASKPAAEGRTGLFRKAVARWPFINDDWPELRRAIPRLTEGQSKVAWLLRWGRSREQIASITGMGESTVNYHTTHLRHELGAAECRDVGPMAGRLVDDLRQREGRLTIEPRVQDGGGDPGPREPPRGAPPRS